MLRRKTENRGRRSPLRPFAAAVGIVAVVIAVSGCITIKSQTTSQRVPGVISLNVAVCATDDDRSVYADCDSAGADRNTEEAHNSGEANFDGLGQVLVGFRVPDGTVAPTGFPSATQDVFFNSSPTYTSALNSKFPPPAGSRWFGYISTPKLFDLENPSGLQTSFQPEFTLPTQPGGAPFAGPFPWRAVVGLRPIDDQSDAGNPVICGTLCFDSPATARVATNLSAPVSDFGVMTAASAAAGHGETATVSFPVRYLDGRGKGQQNLSLTATTDLPGSSATPSVSRLTVAPNSTTTVDVAVPVPPATPLGSYSVSLSAATGSPAVARSITSTIQVTDKVAPTIRISAPAEGATFRLGQAPAAEYGCTDETNGAGLARCDGPVASGAAIDTRSLGKKTFRIDAADNAGNAATASRSYTVLPRLVPAIKLAFNFIRTRTSTTFTNLVVKDVPKGSKVTARCRPERKCPAKAFSKRNAGGTVKLKSFVGKRLAAGTQIDVRVTRRGTIGAVKLVTIRADDAPSIVTRCLPPGATKLRKRC
jgi:hypothetical protein